MLTNDGIASVGCNLAVGLERGAERAAAAGLQNLVALAPDNTYDRGLLTLNYTAAHAQRDRVRASRSR